MTRAAIASLWGPPLEKVLPPALYSRYLLASRFAGLGETADDWKPSIAGIVLLDHARTILSLTSAEPTATIRAMARRDNVRSVTVAPHAYLPTLDDLARLPLQDQARCLAEQLGNLDRENRDTAVIARAWATGDLGTLRTRYVPPSACEDVLAGDARAREAAVRSTLAEIDRGLAAEGRTVVLADVSVLLDPAFFQNLKTRGAEVRPPRE